MYREIRSLTFDEATKQISIPSKVIENIYVYSGAIGVTVSFLSLIPETQKALVSLSPVNNRNYDIAIVYRK